MSRLLNIARNFQFDPSKPLDNRPVDVGSYDINDKNDKRVSDPYQDLARRALDRICQSAQPVGMVPWLRQNHPALYEELIVRLPDDIHRLWVERAPLGEFERILEVWIEAHRTGCEMYGRAQAPMCNSPQGGGQERLRFKESFPQ